MARQGRTLKAAAIGVILTAVVACTTQIRNHGYVPTTAELEAITLGVDTRDTVVETIGSPSAGGVLSDGSYYYVRSKVQHFGAREPKVIERQVVAIDFDSRGIARNIQYLSLEDGKVIPLVVRITDNDLNEQSLLQQLIGNIGGFDASSALSGFGG